MKKTLLILIALLTVSVSFAQTGNYGEFVYGFGAGGGEVGKSSFVVGMPFFSQPETPAYSVTEGVMQAHLIVVNMELAGCQNDDKMSPTHVKDTSGFFLGYDGEEIVFNGATIYVFPAGHYDSTAYDAGHYSWSSQYGYDSLTTLVMDVYPIYELFDTLFLDSAELATYAYEELLVPTTYPILHGGPNKYELSTDHSCDSIRHFYVNLCGGTVKDADGNEYASVFVGNAPQRYCWTKPNMATKTYAKATTDYAAGAAVPNMIYKSETQPDTNANLSTYGRLYTWYAAAGVEEGSDHTPEKTTNGGFVTGICPIGWHLPDSANIISLSEQDAMDLMANILWLQAGHDTGSGFYALPAGFYSHSTGRFEEMLGATFFWSSVKHGYSECWVCSMMFGCNKFINEDMTAENGASVRCVKNQMYNDAGEELND